MPLTLDPVERRLVRLINEQRAAYGVGNGRIQLVAHDSLVNSGRYWAHTMAELQTMAHYIAGTAYPTLQLRLSHFGYNWATAGEIIAAGFNTVESVVAAWMNSPTHRAAILYAGFREIGPGWAWDVDQNIYYCVEFGRRVGQL